MGGGPRTPMKFILALLVLAMLPAASAHLTVTAVAPTEPLMPGVATAIPVTASASCATVAAEYQAMGETELYFGQTPPGLSAFNTTSERVPFTMDQCQPVNTSDPTTSATAYSTGNLFVTPSMTAPYGSSIPFSISVFGNDPTTPEGGDPAVIDIRVAYYGNLSLMAQNIPEDITGPVTLQIMAHVMSNGDSTLKVMAEPANGTVAAIAPVQVTAPATDGLAMRMVTIPISYTPPAGHWHSDSIHLMATLGAQDGLSNTTATSMLHVHLHAAEMHDEEETSTTTSKSSPGVPALLAVGVAALLARRLTTP